MRQDWEAREDQRLEVVRYGAPVQPAPRHPAVLAGDAALGIVAGATRIGLRAASLGVRAGAGVAGLAGGAPGATRLTAAVGRLATPLADDGRRARGAAATEATARLEQLVEVLIPAIVDALDPDRIVRRIDIDALVSRIEIDALVSRIEIDKLVSRIEIDKLVSRIDIDKLVSRIDIDGLTARIDMDTLIGSIDVGAIVDRVDVNEVVQRVDVDAVVEQTELGTIVARSTSGFASEALDSARTQAVDVDDVVTRVVNRILRRRNDDMPLGPSRLVDPDRGDGAPEGEE